MPRAFTLLLALLGGACHQTLGLELPSLPESGSGLLITGHGDEASMVHAFDVSPQGHPELVPEFSTDRDFDLTLAASTCSLSVLGLSPGAQELLGSPRERVELPPLARLERSAIRSGEQAAWTGVPPGEEAIERTLASLPVPEDNLCKLYGQEFGRPEGTSVQTASSAFNLLVVPLDGESALIATREGRFYAVDSSGRTRWLEELPPELPHQAGWGSADGDIWLIGSEGRLARGRIGGSFEIHDVRLSTVTEDSIALTGSDSPGQVELFAITEVGTFERFDGSSWELLAQGVRRGGFEDRGDPEPQVVWVEDGLVVGIGATESPSSLVWYRDGVVSEQRLPPSLGHTTGVEYLPGRGIVVGTTEALLLFERDGSYRELEGHTPSGLSTTNGRIFWPASSGFFFVTYSHRRGPRLIQYSEEADFCTLDVPDVGYITAIAPLSEATLAFAVSWSALDRIQVNSFAPISNRPDCVLSP